MRKKEFISELPVVVCSERCWHVIDVNLLMMVEAKGHYCLLYLKNRKMPVKIRVTLQRVYAALPKDMFAKANNSFIVNVWAIVSFDSTEVTIRHCGRRRVISLTDHKFYLHFYDIFEEA